MRQMVHEDLAVRAVQGVAGVSRGVDGPVDSSPQVGEQYQVQRRSGQGN